MKKMKSLILGLSLAGLLPLSVQAGDICLQVNPTGVFIKFKKPSLSKNSGATLDGVYVVPASGPYPVLVGMIYGQAIMHASGLLDYRLYTGEEGDSYTYLSILSADKKYSGGLINESSGSYYDPVAGEWNYADITGVTPVSCKLVPQF